MGKCKARWRVERRDDKREEALLHDFGVQLRWLREQRRMTLEEAEARSGVSTSSLSAYERGEGNPTLRTVMLLAESLSGAAVRSSPGEGPGAGLYTGCFRLSASVH
ncbi:MAG: helix-turn-helix domain-containing protein [Lawsonibacter sp.]